MNKIFINRTEPIMDYCDEFSYEEMKKQMSLAVINLTEQEKETVNFYIEKYNYEYDSQDYYRFSLKYNSLETDEEYEKRIFTEKELETKNEKFLRQQYLILKEKFG